MCRKRKNAALCVPVWIWQQWFSLDGGSAYMRLREPTAVDTQEIEHAMGRLMIVARDG